MPAPAGDPVPIYRGGIAECANLFGETLEVEVEVGARTVGLSFAIGDRNESEDPRPKSHRSLEVKHRRLINATSERVNTRGAVETAEISSQGEHVPPVRPLAEAHDANGVSILSLRSFAKDSIEAAASSQLEGPRLRPAIGYLEH
jgi:hypothetical protein